MVLLKGILQVEWPAGRRLAIQHVVTYNSDQPIEEPEEEPKACNEDNSRHSQKPKWQRVLIEVKPLNPLKCFEMKPDYKSPKNCQYRMHGIGKDSVSK